MKLAIILPLLFFTSFFSNNIFAQSDSITWVGCGISKKAYMNDLAAAYKQYTGLTINLQGGGATKGIRSVAAGTADIGGSCRYSLPDHEGESKVGFEPVAWDALVTIVNKSNSVQNITYRQIHDVYLGKIKNWKQLGGSDSPIELYTRKGKISGVGYTIRKLLFANPNQEFIATKEFKSSGPLEKAIIENPNAIGITGISSARLRDVKILSMNDKYPDYKTIKSGQYALYRPLFLTYNPDSKHINTIKDFIKFCHSSYGRKVMKKNQVVPYLEALPLVMKQIKQEQLAQHSSSNDFSGH